MSLGGWFPGMPEFVMNLYAAGAFVSSNDHGSQSSEHEDSDSETSSGESGQTHDDGHEASYAGISSEESSPTHEEGKDEQGGDDQPPTEQTVDDHSESEDELQASTGSTSSSWSTGLPSSSSQLSAEGRRVLDAYSQASNELLVQEPVHRSVTLGFARELYIATPDAVACTSDRIGSVVLMPFCKAGELTVTINPAEDSTYTGRSSTHTLVCSRAGLLTDHVEFVLVGAPQVRVIPLTSAIKYDYGVPVFHLRLTHENWLAVAWMIENGQSFDPQGLPSSYMLEIVQGILSVSQNPLLADESAVVLHPGFAASYYAPDAEVDVLVVKTNEFGAMKSLCWDWRVAFKDDLAAWNGPSPLAFAPVLYCSTQSAGSSNWWAVSSPFWLENRAGFRQRVDPCKHALSPTSRMYMGVGKEVAEDVILKGFEGLGNAPVYLSVSPGYWDTPVVFEWEAISTEVVEGRALTSSGGMDPSDAGIVMHVSQMTKFCLTRIKVARGVAFQPSELSVSRSATKKARSALPLEMFGFVSVVHNVPCHR